MSGFESAAGAAKVLGAFGKEIQEEGTDKESHAPSVPLGGRSTPEDRFHYWCVQQRFSQLLSAPTRAARNRVVALALVGIFGVVLFRQSEYAEAPLGRALLDKLWLTVFMLLVLGSAVSYVFAFYGDWTIARFRREIIEQGRLISVGTWMSHGGFHPAMKEMYRLNPTNQLKKIDMPILGVIGELPARSMRRRAQRSMRVVADEVRRCRMAVALSFPAVRTVWDLVLPLALCTTCVRLWWNHTYLPNWIDTASLWLLGYPVH